VWLAISRIVGVADIQKKYALGMQGALDLIEHPHQSIDVLLDGLLMSQLTIISIVSHPIIWRAGHCHIEAVCRKRTKRFHSIAVD
jgi:hypothetical protein